MNTNSKTADLKAAFSENASAISALEKIQAALCDKELPKLDNSAVEKACLDLEDCIARRSLGEADEVEEKQARATVKNADIELAERQKVHARASLEFGGLNRRLLLAEQEKEVAEKSMTDATEAWILEELRIADEAYCKLVEELMPQYFRVASCHQALARRGIQSGAYSSAIVIPTIGPASIAAVVKKTNGRDHGVGQNLFNEMRCHLTISNNEIERSLQDLQAELLNSPESSIGRFAKMVTGLRVKA